MNVSALAASIWVALFFGYGPAWNALRGVGGPASEMWLLALWADIAILVGIVTLVTLALVAGLDMDVAAGNIVAAGVGLFLLVAGFGTIAFAVGAATGRRTYGLGAAAGLAVLAYILDALGPALDADWMTAISPFAWYLTPNPLVEGVDWGGFVLLALVPVVAAVAGLSRFVRRDLMV